MLTEAGPCLHCHLCHAVSPPESSASPGRARQETSQQTQRGCSVPFVPISPLSLFFSRAQVFEVKGAACSSGLQIIAVAWRRWDVCCNVPGDVGTSVCWREKVGKGIKGMMEGRQSPGAGKSCSVLGSKGIKMNERRKSWTQGEPDVKEKVWTLVSGPAGCTGGGTWDRLHMEKALESLVSVKQ